MPRKNPPDDPVRPGGFLDHFFVLKELGSGKMCSVHLAFDVRNLDLAAIKKLHKHHQSVESFRKRLLREAEILKQFRHPHLLGLVENRVESESSYLAVEFLRGDTLDNRLRSEGGSLFVAEAFRYLGEVASGLHYAHQKGIVHRDIRPENIMVDHVGTARLFDFGIAKADDQIVQTQIGDVGLMGEYASPEQMMGKPLTARSDLYSLGAVVYQCLTGQKVIKARTVEQLIHEINRPVRPPSSVDSDIPPVLDPIMEKLLAKDAAARYSSAKELLIDLGKLYATEDEGQRRTLFGRVEDARLAWARRAFEEKEYARVYELAEDAEDYAPYKKAAFLRLAGQAHLAEGNGGLALRMFGKASFCVPEDINYLLDYVIEMVRQDEVARAVGILGEKTLKSPTNQSLIQGLRALLAEWNAPEVSAIREAAAEGGGFLGRIGSFFHRGGR